MAASSGWGPGWPAGAQGQVVTAVTGGRGLRLPVRVELVPLVAGLVADLEASRGEAFRPDWSWGYANRPISGTTVPSNHSRGTAVDLNAPENPYLPAAMHAAPHPLRKRIAGRLLRTTMPDDVVDIAARWGFTWGGLYQRKPDPMHLESALTPLGAAALIADLRALAGRPVAAHPWPWEADVPAPSDVVGVAPVPAALRAPGAGDDAVIKLRADGTLEYHGASAEVASWGDYRRLKAEHRQGHRYFHAAPIIGPDSVTCYANDGTRWLFDAGTKPLLEG